MPSSGGVCWKLGVLPNKRAGLSAGRRPCLQLGGLPQRGGRGTRQTSHQEGVLCATPVHYGDR